MSVMEAHAVVVAPRPVPACPVPFMGVSPRSGPEFCWRCCREATMQCARHCPCSGGFGPADLCELCRQVLRALDGRPLGWEQAC